MIEFQTEGLPAHYPKRPGVRLLIVDKQKALRRGFYDYVARLVAQDVPVILAACGPPGHFPAGAFLNDALKPAVLRRDLPEFEAVFERAQQDLESHRFNPAVHVNGPQSRATSDSQMR